MNIENVSFLFRKLSYEEPIDEIIYRIIQKVQQTLRYFKNEYPVNNAVEKGNYLRAKMRLMFTDEGVEELKVLWFSNNEKLLRNLSEIWSKIENITDENYLLHFNDKYPFSSVDKDIIPVASFTQSFSNVEYKEELTKIKDKLVSLNNPDTFAECKTIYTTLRFAKVKLANPSSDLWINEFKVNSTCAFKVNSKALKQAVVNTFPTSNS